MSKHVAQVIEYNIILNHRIDANYVKHIRYIELLNNNDDDVIRYPIGNDNANEHNDDSDNDNVIFATSSNFSNILTKSITNIITICYFFHSSRFYFWRKFNKIYPPIYQLYVIFSKYIIQTLIKQTKLHINYIFFDLKSYN